MTGLREKLDLANHQLISMINISAQVYHKVQIAADRVEQDRKYSNWYKNMSMYVVALQNKSVVSSNLSLIYTGFSNVGLIHNDRIAMCLSYKCVCHIYAQINMIVFV